MAALRTIIEAACEGLGNNIDASPIITETIKNLYDGVPMAQVYDSAILASRTLIEKDPAYSQVTARILMHVIRKEILGREVLQGDMQAEYSTYFAKYINEGISAELLDPRMREFDLPRLAAALNACTLKTAVLKCHRLSSCALQWACL
jgi:ribonucleoside-diphosphate reductase alpha chain